MTRACARLLGTIAAEAKRATAMVRWCDRGRDTAAGSRCMNSSADSQRGMFGTMAFVVNRSAIALPAGTSD